MAHGYALYIIRCRYRVSTNRDRPNQESKQPTDSVNARLWAVLYITDSIIYVDYRLSSCPYTTV